MIDYHTHIGEERHYSREYADEGFRMRGRPARRATPVQHAEAMKDMDGVVVLAFKSRLLGFEVPNAYVAEYCASDTARLLGFASVDPHDGDALTELRTAHRDLGLRGLKTSAIYQGYHPMDDRMLPIYAYCQDNGLPILTHHGTTFPRRAPLKWAHPEQLEQVALAFPELRMIIAHLGHPWESETIVLIRKHPHLYSDVSALFYRPWQLYGSLTLAKEYGVWHKLIFGTDYPVTEPGESIAGLRKMAEYAEAMPFPGFGREDIEALLVNDIRKELNLV